MLIKYPLSLFVSFAALMASIVAGCVPSSSPASTGTKPPTPFVRRITMKLNPTATDLGIVQAFDFEFVPPPNTSCVYWVETYVHGKLDKKLCWGCEKTSTDDQPGTFRFSRFDPDCISEQKTKRARWTIENEGDRQPLWVDDPFKTLDNSIQYTTSAQSWSIVPGTVYTVQTLIGGRNIHVIGENDVFNREHNDVCAFIKIRFDPLPPGRRENVSRSFSGIPSPPSDAAKTK